MHGAVEEAVHGGRGGVGIGEAGTSIVLLLVGW